MTLVRQRTDRFDGAKRVVTAFEASTRFRGRSLLFVTEPAFDRTREGFETYDDHSLSFTAASTIALVNRHDIDAASSFDDDFDGIVERLDPTAV